MPSQSNDHRRLFTSESVSMGHPDKVSDQISDALLDSLIEVDPRVRVACETLCTTGLVVMAGEVTVHTPQAIARLNMAEQTARQTIKEIGYTDPTAGFSYDSCAVIRTIHAQSADIARGVDREGAGDQGLMFGFACRETREMMPMPIFLAHRLVERQAYVRQKGLIPGIRPDAKSQVTVEYAGQTPVGIHTVVLSTQHTPAWNGAARQKQLKQQVIRHIIEPVLKPTGIYRPGHVTIHVNPTGQFETGGPHGDTGLTGRKIIVDTYGGRGCHGGGAFSGKDPTKVDRSASYMARHIAKNIVAARLADVCEVQVSYAIGVADPLSVMADTEGTGKLSDEDLAEVIRKVFPLRPRQIIEYLDLRRPIYKKTARNGHFGRNDPDFTWEKTHRIEDLRRAARV